MRAQFERDGRLISYLDVPASAPRHAGTVVFLHAFPLDADLWHPQLASAPSAWRFLAPDLRGFGDSSADAPGAEIPDTKARLSIDDFADDVLALLDHLRVENPVVCGLSMGGYVAFALCRRSPQRVRGLVLADTRPDADTEAARAARRTLLDALRERGSAAVTDAMLPRLLGRTSLASRPDLVNRVRALILEQSPAALGAGLVRLMTRPDSTPVLAGLDCPVLVIAGEEDEVTGPDVARQMHGQVAGAELALIRHAGHLSNLEQPEAFSSAVDRFLATRFLQP